jgi:hypothetical protein
MLIMQNLIKLPVQVRTIHTINPRLNAYYPVIEGLNNTMAERRINQTIAQITYDLMEEQGYFSNPNTVVTAGYEIKTNQREVLSLSLINYAFSGGAHGLTIIKSPTFSVATGRLYQLQDLFKPGADYVARLSEIIGIQIERRNIPILGEFTGIRPDQDFYIADKALVIYFQLYEITPYAYGFPYFPISVYEIQDIIDKDGPLGKMMGSF